MFVNFEVIDAIDISYYDRVFLCCVSFFNGISILFGGSRKKIITSL